SLDGHVRAARGVLPVALHCRRASVARLLVPAANAVEAAVVTGLTVIPIETIHDAVEYLNGERDIAPQQPDSGPWASEDGSDHLDLADVRGHAHAKRALEIAAAGGHNVLRFSSITNWSLRRSASWNDAVDLYRVLAKHNLV